MLKDKIQPLIELVKIRQKFKDLGKTVVFTNGVFDILHRGHVEYLTQARELGDCLFVGLNSDTSVEKVKGPGKPLVKQEDRAIVLAGLMAVDYICFFDEETPQNMIQAIIPDILVKGGDYQISEIVGRDIVEENGGKVVTVPTVEGFSTSELTRRIARLMIEKEKIR
ncbi:MAG: D-glycero-beta-D-manno-heptose 1-phosphate adenylyltransferase [bacterium]|nr:MAG: D-glycero-beta-D-manno-heptose 1-phosphate adenylyltransferase [bacterium]